MQNHRKAAVEFLERESAEWAATAAREMADKQKRDIGRIRLFLVAECRKLLSLMRLKQKS